MWIFIFIFIFLETSTHTKERERDSNAKVHITTQLNSQAIVIFKGWCGKLYYIQYTILRTVGQLLIHFLRNVGSCFEQCPDTMAMGDPMPPRMVFDGSLDWVDSPRLYWAVYKPICAQDVNSTT